MVRQKRKKSPLLLFRPMDKSFVEKIAGAVLYEGYMLYPYRASSVKNRQRFNWGTLVPRSYSEAQRGTEACEMQTEVLVRGNGETAITGKIRFLHLTSREIWKAADNMFEMVESMDVGGRLYQSWDEAIECAVELISFSLKDVPCGVIFSVPKSVETGQILNPDGSVAGMIVRKRATINGGIEIKLEEAKRGIFRIRVKIRNLTASEVVNNITRERVLLSSTVSTHTILNVTGGEFVSLLDPPDELKEIAAECRNIGTYPVLAGENKGCDCMLSSPIILYDHPEIASASPGELFDGTEIDEILTLRIMTLTEEEKREMRAVDDRARAILERTEMMPEEQFIKMHGALRGLNKKSKTTYG